MRARISDDFEYYAARGAIAALRMLGWRGGAKFGELIGRSSYELLRIRREVTERQIAFAFPGLAHGEVQRIARSSYDNIGRTMAETTLLRYKDRDFVLSLASEVQGWDILQEAIDQGRGVLLATGHMGNWELAGCYLAARGLPLAAVARRMGNRRFDAYVNETRSRLGIRVIYEADAVRQAPRLLRDGGVLALLADQGVRGLASTFVPFFGRLARTPRGPAVLSVRLNAPLIFGISLRDPDGRFRFVFERLPIEGRDSHDAHIDAMVAAYTHALERWVRRAPEQYFWMHRRWRRRPPGQPLLEDHEI